MGEVGIGIFEVILLEHVPVNDCKVLACQYDVLDVHDCY
jgi:hypothetical protein